MFFSSIVDVRALNAANTGLEKLSFRRVGSKRHRSGAVGPIPLGKQDDHQANVNHIAAVIHHHRSRFCLFDGWEEIMIESGVYLSENNQDMLIANILIYLEYTNRLGEGGVRTQSFHKTAVFGYVTESRKQVLTLPKSMCFPKGEAMRSDR